MYLEEIRRNIYDNLNIEDIKNFCLVDQFSYKICNNKSF